MITDEQFRKTEGRLYRYYKTIKEIEKLELECEDLEKQKEQIRKDIKETNIVIEEESRSITYEERVQATSTGISYAEKSLIQEIEKLEYEWILIRKKLLKNRI